MQGHELLEFILDTLTELASLHAAAAAAAERAWSVLDGQDKAVLHNAPYGDQRRNGLSRDRLTVNPTTFTVQWRGQSCNLGPTILFKLIHFLARRPGRYCTYDVLMEHVWGQCCSSTTIRSAVKRLRQAVRDAGMPDLAAAIRGRRECYGVFLDDGSP
jgi:DNA-binding response OmpR family regulator